MGIREWFRMLKIEQACSSFDAEHAFADLAYIQRLARQLRLEIEQELAAKGIRVSEVEKVG